MHLDESCESEVSYFRYCRRLDGKLEPVDVAKRNGRRVPYFHPSMTEPASNQNGDEPDAGKDFASQSRFFVNLNPVERETWRKILSAQSIASIAKEEGVSRAAIYSRICGNSKGQGGMISKNFWVLLWWQLRQRLLTSPNHH